MIRTIKVVSGDTKDTYGYLSIENVSVNQIQHQIDEIKNSIEFKHEISEDWDFEDILERFPSEWKWHYITDDGYTVKV